jgi:hypothetical protein
MCHNTKIPQHQDTDQHLFLEGDTDRQMCTIPRSGGGKTSASGDYFCLQGAKILQASHFDYEYMLGHKIVFVCVAKGTPQPQITWFKDGIELYAHSYLHVSMPLRKTYLHIHNIFPMRFHWSSCLEI